MKAKPPRPKKELLCRYMSGTFSSSEINYPTHEKETLAVIRMLEKHRTYVLDKEFIVRTDSTYVTGFKNINHNGTYKQGRLIRWQMKLVEYNYSISRIKGEKNVLADILSREWRKHNRLSQATIGTKRDTKNPKAERTRTHRSRHQGFKSTT